MRQTDLDQLKIEIDHIFESGANEIRVFEMVKSFIDKRYVDRERMARNCKPPCHCGKPSISKGLCSYHYYQINFAQKKLTPKSNSLFVKVLDKVKQGLTISEACLFLEIERTNINRFLTRDQIHELKINKKPKNEKIITTL